ncbi:microfibril-associated glycoprotein 4-like [Dendronephthya gigantea]|uniref:microfibril-associated glycoprotein 4-like n=1 Tax=Dendronephthya gigantea TaxID=151771 RepID=UPI00106CDEDD|nr:microfibril-associated glycoprotein 4-like [Dendronephthya gigantea]
MIQFLFPFILAILSVDAVYFEDGELCMVKRNFTVATCGLKPEIVAIKNALSRMENEISSLGSELRQVKKTCGSCVHREARSCADNLYLGATEDGLYYIDPDGNGKFKVFCDMTTSGGGWTVFQRRLDGSVDFYRGWQDYKTGFGTLYGEHWLGLEKIHRITKSQKHELRIELEDFSGNTRFAQYTNVSISNESDKYRINLGVYSGNAGGNALRLHENMAFTTKDSDNDLFNENCAVKFKGAWWYNKCHHSNLNGDYHQSALVQYGNGIIWYEWKGYYFSLKHVSMKIRAV